ncbi:MAG TPA: PQQ-binding-like beta-propeller repeat protein [Candidatus Sulfotelmatobacter sp.]
MKRSRARTAASTIFVLITLPICAQVNVTTYHNDNLRTGQNTNETTLDDVFVAGSSFARIFQASVDGQIYGQPLVLSNLSIGGGSHNVVYVATENDSVYAFDAATGFQYWKTSLGSPLPSNETGGGSSCTDIKGPSYGITATPVIDTSVSPPLIYVVAQNGTEYQLNALSAETGLSAAGAVTITGTYSGASFDAINQLIRPALLLENGHVIFAAGSHCDLATWYGWVFSYNSITPKTPSFAQQAIFNTQPTGNSGGIWMSGGGVASDSSGYVYFSTGNSPDYVPPDYDNAMVKLNPVPASPSQQWTVADYFMPSASDLRGSEDHDVGSGGVLLIPNASQLVGMGKTGVLYLVNTTTGKMGKFCSSCNGNDTNIIQEIDNASHGVWGSPAFWNNNLYYGSSTGPVARFSYNVNGSGKLSTSPTTVTQQSFAGAPTPSISANGTNYGLLWVLDNDSWGSGCCAVLYAYDATKLEYPEFASSNVACNQAGGAIKFAVPTVANGKVYVGGQSQLTAFGTVVPGWTFSASLPPGTSCSNQGSEYNFTLSLDQQCGSNSREWSSSLSTGQLVVQIDLSWTLSDSKGQLMSNTAQKGTVNITMPRAPVGTPTLSLSGYMIGENGCYAPIQETLTGTN